MEKPLVIFLDFDGTVAYRDVGYHMVKRFASEGWEEINLMWEEGALSTAQCAQKTLDIMKVSPAELEEFFLEQELDPGFESFLEWISTRPAPLYIVSDGYDNYIEPILKKHGLSIPYYANHLDYDGGWIFTSFHSNPECGKCGTCKSSIVQEQTPPGAVSIYIGDGYSDRCAAGGCDIVLAKDALASHCQENNIPFHHFKDFYDVIKILNIVIEQGEKKSGA
ncbi:MAG: MtnX-like HAD-IB family phosphatase [Syntrophomonadaceae bacterium]